MPPFLVAAALLAAPLGCGSEDVGHSAEPAVETTWPRTALGDPNASRPYPAPPYGMGQGMTLPNLELLGWRAPTALATSCSAAEEPPALDRIAFAELYDPDGSKGLELILVNVSAVWCTVCRSEFATFKSQRTYEAYRARGVEFVGVLFEDADHRPAKPRDLSCWSSTYDVAFPMLLDPAFKTGPLFTSEATPMNVVIDARTMEVIGQFAGAGGALVEMFDFIDRELGRRQ